MKTQCKWNKGIVLFLALSFCGVLFVLANGLATPVTTYSMSMRITHIIFPHVPFEHPSFAHYEMVVRKIAHLLEYAALGMWLWFLKISLATVEKTINGWCLCFFLLLIGVLDEFFQTLSQRSGTVSDVLIDLLGGLLGMVTAIAIHKLWKIYKNRRNHHG